MRQVRCQRCGHMFTISRDLLDAALIEIEENDYDYYMLDCPRCRNAVKVQRAELERMRPYQPEETPSG